MNANKIETNYEYKAELAAASTVQVLCCCSVKSPDSLSGGAGGRWSRWRGWATAAVPKHTPRRSLAAGAARSSADREDRKSSGGPRKFDRVHVYIENWLILNISSSVSQYFLSQTETVHASALRLEPGPVPRVAGP